MAGLYDRVTRVSPDRISVHHFQAILILRAAGELTDEQAITLVNERLITPLEGSEITDANSILSVLDGKNNAASKIQYALKVDAVNMLTESGASLATESNWRAALEI